MIQKHTTKKRLNLCEFLRFHYEPDSNNENICSVDYLRYCSIANFVNFGKSRRSLYKSNEILTKCLRKEVAKKRQNEKESLKQMQKLLYLMSVLKRRGLSSWKNCEKKLKEKVELVECKNELLKARNTTVIQDLMRSKNEIMEIKRLHVVEKEKWKEKEKEFLRKIEDMEKKLQNKSS